MQNTDDFDELSFTDKFLKGVRGLSGTSPVSGQSGILSVPVKLSLFIILVLFIVSVYWVGFSGDQTAKDAEISKLPLLSASSEPFRVRPDEPGGMEIPNKDSTIYSALDGNRTQQSEDTKTDKLPDVPDDTAKADTPPDQASGPDENADGQSAPSGFAGSKQFAGLEKTLKARLPELEKSESELAPQTGSAQSSDDSNQPKIENLAKTQQIDTPESKPSPATTESTPPASQTPRPGLKPDIKTAEAGPETDKASTENGDDSDNANDQRSPETEQARLTKEERTDKADDKAGDEMDKILSPILEEETAEQTASTQEQTEEDSTKNKPDQSGNKFYVQLGSVQSKSKAEQEWQRLSAKYPDQLKDKPYRVEDADLGDRGIFYRVQAGPFEQLTARTICRELKNAGKTGGCLVVAP